MSEDEPGRKLVQTWYIYGMHVFKLCISLQNEQNLLFAHSDLTNLVVNCARDTQTSHLKSVDLPTPSFISHETREWEVANRPLRGW